MLHLAGVSDAVFEITGMFDAFRDVFFMSDGVTAGERDEIPFFKCVCVASEL